ncbi:DUF3883 domain-containing protein [Streptococcus marimammalium]|uniref:DUF3883 domain-containing protein n=1 Tax=Streptococcus marimammalium TaxID=269666 RepID=UPI00035E5980|nr:DUF3883 domain-containing protein [Streptococcus marimammalium]
MASKHKNYEVLNLIGYGLAKFNMAFVQEFGFNTKIAFYRYFVDLKLVATSGVLKNRMDLFDPYFDNGRRGWWQKADVYRHRKDLIDTLFGQANAKEFADIVKLYLKENYHLSNITVIDKPIISSRFKRLQETGLEAELYFMSHYKEQDLFRKGILEDARLYGDGYDFQISVGNNHYLSEVKGIRAKHGTFRMTEKEYEKAKQYRKNYVISLVTNLDESPKILLIDDPTHHLEFKKLTKEPKPIVEYHLVDNI